VLDASGVELAYVYCSEDVMQMVSTRKPLTFDEGRRIARGIARLPDFLRPRR
jgi:hypothetical protein